jgi:hypothetical protein
MADGGPRGLPDALRQAGTLACLSHGDTGQAVPITAFIAAEEGVGHPPSYQSKRRIVFLDLILARRSERYLGSDDLEAGFQEDPQRVSIVADRSTTCGSGALGPGREMCRGVQARCTIRTRSVADDRIRPGRGAMSRLGARRSRKPLEPEADTGRIQLAAVQVLEDEM